MILLKVTRSQMLKQGRAVVVQADKASSATLQEWASLAAANGGRLIIKKSDKLSRETALNISILGGDSITFDL